MKRFLLCFLFGFLMLPLLAEAQASAKDKVCQIVSLQGDVQVETAGTARAAALGEYLKEGDSVRTGKESFALLSYDPQGKQVVEVGAESSVAIMAIRPTDLSLKAGELIAKIKQLGKNETFEISTPVCVAAVRGTMYGVRHGADGSRVKSFEHTIDVFNLTKEDELGEDNRQLRQGFALGVDMNRAIGPMSRLTAADLAGRDAMNKRVREVNFQRMSQDHPAPAGSSFDKVQGGGFMNMGNAFNNMDNKPSNPNTTEVNQQVLDTTKKIEKSESQKNCSYPYTC